MGEEISKRDCAILTGDLNIGARREYQPKFPSVILQTAATTITPS